MNWFAFGALFLSYTERTLSVTTSLAWSRSGKLKGGHSDED